MFSALVVLIILILGANYLFDSGSITGGCALHHNTSKKGYEFLFKYIVDWDSNSSKPDSTFNAYRCNSGTWKVADITLNAWREKMCGEFQGMMISVEVNDLAKFPSLYDSKADIRVVTASANNTSNATYPRDVVGPGWVTPGSVDFEVDSFADFDASSATFEDIMKEGYVSYENCWNGIDDDEDKLVDCYDWDCQFFPNCTSSGVNAAGYADTTTPKIIGTKIEEYWDAALVMYDTNKPTNGTLLWYDNSSTCSGNATEIYDRGLLSNNMRNFSLWHVGEIYHGNNSLNSSLSNSTTYYYKLKVCDSGGKCAQSKCMPLKTPSTKCAYCNFVTKIKAPSGWSVYYDLDADGTFEHWQFHECGPKAGLKTNYSSGRRANIKMNNTEGAAMWFYNVSLTKSGLSTGTRDISVGQTLIYNDSATNSGGDTIGYVGMLSETRDKIINNLHPEVCRISIPKGDTDCDVLYHCDDSGDNCVDRTLEATNLGASGSFCVWELPYCEFSVWASDEPASSTSSTSSSSGGGGGGGGGASATNMYTVWTEEDLAEGYTKDLGDGDKFRVNLSSVWYYVTVDALTNTSVTFNVTGNNPTTFSIGDSKNFDVDGDGNYDITVTVNSINTTTSEANVKVQTYTGVAESDDTTETGDTEEGVTEDLGDTGEGTAEGFNYTWLIAAIVVIAIIAYFVMGSSKKKK